MPLTNFFAINLPYGIKKLPDGSWTPFNREYAPLGYNQHVSFLKEQKNGIPIHTHYEGDIEKIAQRHNLQTREEGKYKFIYFYDEETDPTYQGIRLKQEFKWSRYFNILIELSELKVRK